jgi:CHAD domain-containing protein
VSASRAYRIDPDQPLPDELARVARGRIEHALDELLGETDSTPEEAVHEARKDMKKLRALLRLARGELGKEVFARENAFFRDAARELAGVRDADVMLETLAKLDLKDGATELRRRLEAHRVHDGAGDRAAASLRAVAQLEEALTRVREWPLERDSFDAIGAGLERSYRRGRSDLLDVRAEPGTDALHEWRKRVKGLWYHHTLLRKLWTPVMTSVADEAHELADLLGDDHDLAVLSEWASLNGCAQPGLSAAVERRRSELQEHALKLGARLYAEKPGAYRRRLERLWEARVRAVRAP